MTAAADLVSLGADHHWEFDGDSVDLIAAVVRTDSGIIFTDSNIALDATNCMTTNGLTDRVSIATTTDINNSAQARKAVIGWYQTTVFQGPPSMIYNEGTQTTAFRIAFGFGNNLIFECVEPTNFPLGLQIYGLALVPGRSYHLCAIFLGNTQGNEIKLFIDGVEFFNADPLDRQPDTASLDSRGVAEFGDPAGTVGLGGGVVIQQAARNGRYQHWATWGDEADADLTDTEIRETLFEKQALSEETVVTATQANMQIALDALTVAQPNAACCVDIEAVTGGGDFQLESDLTFDDLASIHFRFRSTAADTLTIVNVSGGDATTIKSSAPFGGIIVIATRQTLTVTVLDINTGSVISGARVYMEADTGGDLSAGTEIMNAATNGSGVATVSHDYTTDQPIIGYVRKGTSSTYYKVAAIAGPLVETALNVTILMVPD